ncbi:MAG TPA: metallophosphoesterase [Vicinamibacterales bacterium]|nr:metallophosphoesterase [Vicinamibacterales bacterium]
MSSLSRAAAGERTRALAGFAALLAVVAAFAPIWAAEPERVAGLALFAGAAAEAVQGFRRRTPATQHNAWSSSAYTLLLSLLLLNASWLAATALAIFLTVPFVIDGLRYAWLTVKQLTTGKSALQAAGAMAWNLAVAAAILLVGRYAAHWVVGLAAGLRLAATSVNLATAPVYSEQDADQSVIADIGIDRPERLAETSAQIERSEEQRAAADRSWIAALLVVLLTIHVSRMGFDRTALGIVAPLVAVLGDVVCALVLAYFVIVPLRLFGRRVTRRLEARAWERVLAVPAPVGLARWADRAVRWWLTSRMRFAIRARSARYSLTVALGRGLQIGLPLAAIVVASVPIWGMSWYFDTENWAAGMWNSWAAQRTDTWREAMVRAVVTGGQTTIDGRGFMVTPPGVAASAPFSFVVIGDTGEGDASQHVLRDSLIRASAAEDVKFVVLSSDVVYPTGAMRDYELRFWLPFMGVTKPVFAIPGNHDWYDALEGFAATFLRPEAARLAMRARIDADDNVSSTTDAVIDDLIGKAAALRGQYGVPTGFQQAPFFQVQTPDFALFGIDTGVLRRIDPEQLTWLRAALEASRGKMMMAVLGHPFFAGGHDVSAGDEDFTAVRSLLREHGVQIVMAGDTHDLEYYAERGDSAADAPLVHHFVNGGGGAYLSFGTSLAWPAQPATTDWAYYPNHRDVVAKITTTTPWWKWGAWFWTREFGAWPSSPEWLSAMFDYNVAPFFQSFVVVTVDPAARTVTIRPWGIRGPLTWKDLERSAQVMPPGTALDQPVAWLIRQ